MARKPLSFYEVFKPPDESSEKEDTYSREERPEARPEETAPEKTSASSAPEPVQEPAAPEPEYAELEPVEPPAAQQQSKPKPEPSAAPRPKRPEPAGTGPEGTSQSMPFPSGETSANKRFVTIGVDTAIILTMIIFFMLYISYRIGHKEGYGARSAELSRIEETNRINSVQAKPLDQMTDIKNLVRDRKANPVTIPGTKKSRPRTVKRKTAPKTEPKYKYTIRIVWTSKQKARDIINDLKKKKFDVFTDRSGKAVYVGKFRTISEERAVEMLHYFKRLQKGNSRPFKTAYFVPMPERVVD